MQKNDTNHGFGIVVMIFSVRVIRTEFARARVLLLLRKNWGGTFKTVQCFTSCLYSLLVLLSVAIPLRMILVEFPRFEQNMIFAQVTLGLHHPSARLSHITRCTPRNVVSNLLTTNIATRAYAVNVRSFTPYILLLCRTIIIYFIVVNPCTGAHVSTS